MHNPEMQRVMLQNHQLIQGVEQEIPDYLPTDFDSRMNWPGCIGRILNQGDCGSCWAFASTEVVSDRFCIHSGGQINVTLSPQNLLSCEDVKIGCLLGTLPEFAFEYFKNKGVATLNCVPYVSGNGSVPKCSDKEDMCTNSTDSNLQLYRVLNYSQVGDFIYPGRHIAAIMEALYEDGPVDATFNIFADFYNYAGGVYRHTEGAYEGLHSVKIIGWGVETYGSNNTDYWLVQNSWGDWGPYNGYFKILRGVDECGIESLVFTGFPLLS